MRFRIQGFYLALFALRQSLHQLHCKSQLHSSLYGIMVFFGLTAFLLISGCSNKIVIPDRACIYKDGSQTVAPDWLCQKTTQADQRYAVGYAAASITGREFSEKMAINAATNQLMRSLWQDLRIAMQQWHNNRVADLPLNWASKDKKTATPQSDTATNLYFSLRQQIKISDFQQIQLLQSIQTPSGGMAALINLDRVGLQNLIEQAINTVAQQQPTIWNDLIEQTSVSDLAIELIDYLPAK